MSTEAIEALKNIIWKLDRMEADDKGEAFRPARIDRHDIVIRDAVKVAYPAGEHTFQHS